MPFASAFLMSAVSYAIRGSLRCRAHVARDPSLAIVWIGLDLAYQRFEIFSSGH